MSRLPHSIRLGTVSLCAALGLSRGASGEPCTVAGTPLAVELYRVKPKEALSQILFERSIGVRGHAFRLYGDDGWVAFTRRLNGMSSDLTQPLMSGEELRLVVPPQGPSEATPTFYVYYVKPNDTLSQILFRCGVGAQGTASRLYGDHGWIDYALRLNAVQGERNLAVGRQLFIELPAADSPNPPTPNRALAALPRLSAPEPVPKSLPEPTPAPTPEPEPPAAPASPAEVKAKAQELTVEKIAVLAPEEVAKIPEEVKTEKAWELSFFDSFKPGMDQLFSGLASTTASAYLATRYGFSLADRVTPLTRYFTFYSVLAELRGGNLAGLRVSWDYAPTIIDIDQGEEVRFGMRRLLVGWAFEFNAPVLIDKVHVTPKVGRYWLASRLVEEPATDSEGAELQTSSINGAPSSGIEIDLEKAAFFYILRGWFAADTPLSRLKLVKSAKSVTSNRAGLDFFIKGKGLPGLGDRTSLAYLLFLANEQLLVEDNSAEDTRAILLGLPLAGVGVSLSW